MPFAVSKTPGHVHGSWCHSNFREASRVSTRRSPNKSLPKIHWIFAFSPKHLVKVEQTQGKKKKTDDSNTTSHCYRFYSMNGSDAAYFHHNITKQNPPLSRSVERTGEEYAGQLYSAPWLPTLHFFHNTTSSGDKKKAIKLCYDCIIPFSHHIISSPLPKIPNPTPNTASSLC